MPPSSHRRRLPIPPALRDDLRLYRESADARPRAAPAGRERDPA